MQLRSIVWPATVVAAIAAVWLLLGRTPRELVPRIENGDIPPVGEPALVAPEASDRSDAASPSRAAVEPTAVKDEKRRRPTVEPAPDEALLRIHAIARETGRDLPEVRFDLRVEGVGMRIGPGRKRSRGRAGEGLYTDERGTVEFVVPSAKEVRLFAVPMASIGGADQQLPPLQAGETRTVEVALPTVFDFRLRGQVLDAETRSPVPGATIVLVDTGFAAQSDERGAFELVTAAWRHEVLWIESPAYSRKLIEIGPEDKSETDPLTIALVRAAELELHVTDARGVPLSAARACAESLDLGSSLALFAATEGERWCEDTDARGVCTLQLPSRERLSLELLAAEDQRVLGDQDIQLEPGEHRVLSISIADGTTIEGLVIDGEGRPQGALDVWLLPDESKFRFDSYGERDFDKGNAFRTLSDSMGRFAFERVPPGIWWLGPGRKQTTRPEEAAAATPVEVRVDGNPVAPVTLIVSKGRCIRGRIVRPDGAAYVPPQVMLCFVSGTSAEFSAHDYPFDDTFVLGPLMPGTYRVSATTSDFAGSEPVEARDGDEDVVLRLREGGRLSGVVLDSNARGMQRLSILAMGANGQVPGLPGEGGSFRLGPLAPGLWDLLVTSPSGGAAYLRDISVEAGGERSGLELRLEPAARLILRVSGEAAHLYCTVSLDDRWIGTQWLGDPSRNNFVAVPGSLEVRLYRSAFGTDVLLETRTVEAHAGEEHVVEFAIEPEGSPK